MKKALSIILAFALLAVPFAITTVANTAPACPEDDYTITCDCEEILGAENGDDNSDNRPWWQIVIDFILGIIGGIAEIVSGLAPIVTLLNTIASLLRTLSIVIAVVAGSAAVIAIVALIAHFVR
ncbi:MAG: hypothetical protein FWE40_03615 [Oscillospiraceae bacterium]|nr:hypothetical protein [Oscillospiraceae bacterium]